MLTTVTFDCWGTLISDNGYERAMERRVEVLASTCGIDAVAAAELIDRAWRTHHHAWIDQIQYGSGGMAKFCHDELGIDDEGACATLTEAFEESGRLGNQFALDGAADTLRVLKANGVKTALVCDAGWTPGRIVRDFLDAHGLLQHLDFCAFSNEVGVPKPDPRIFRAALDELGSRPEESAHVGDLLRTDIYGARALGMRSVRITQITDDAVEGFSWDRDASFGGGKGTGRAASARFEDADEVVTSHGDLPDALERLGARLPAR